MSGVYTALGVAGAGLLGAGGSVAGGLLSKPSSSVKTQTPPVLAAADPLLAAAGFDTLLNLGIADPSVLTPAGPLERAVQNLQRSTTSIQDADFFNLVAPMILDEVQRSGETDPRRIAENIGARDPQLLKGTTAFINRATLAANKLASVSGMSLGDLLKAEADWRSSTQERFGTLQQLANETLRGRLGAASARAQMLSDLPGSVSGLRDKELARINAQYDEQAVRALQQANVGGFNPGNIVGQIRKSQVENADLEALSRAVNLISGQTNILNALSGQPTTAATQLGQINVGAGVASPGAVQQTGNPLLGPAVAQAFPAGLLSADIIRRIGQSSGPAVNETSIISALRNAGL